MAFLGFLPQIFAIGSRPALPSARVLFMQDFRGATQHLPRGEGEITRARLWTTPSGGEVELKFSANSHNLQIKEHNMLIMEQIIARTPGHGHGDEAMAMLTKMADDRQVHIGMFMYPIGHKAKSMEELIVWAAKYGFEEYNIPPLLFWREPGARNVAVPTLEA